MIGSLLPGILASAPSIINLVSSLHCIDFSSLCAATVAHVTPCVRLRAHLIRHARFVVGG